MGLFSKKPKELEIIAPVDGEVIALDKVENEVFSQKMLGKGLAIKPIAGKLITVFPTGHAYGIKSNNGVEMLLHIGMDTVSLNGKGFDIQVKQDNNVKQGDLLCNVDLAVLKAKNVPSLDTPIVFTPETMSGKTINIVKTGNVKQGEIIAVIK
ncbi:PTS glucose transporter subunit IIA [Spiroplasma endosymbiont of Seladonia tumulorum]|uniref:PTS sugar transporter subunit IIA n=1 Tax=Spiroplasma endosymbiont of Seladonia tumulorum TaxID=3066321 RepID=UPI0030D25258